MRRGSNCDLPCEEAPEASMLLEPLPTPRGPHAQLCKHGGQLHVLHKHSRKPRQHKPSSKGKILQPQASLCSQCSPHGVSSREEQRGTAVPTWSTCAD